MNPKQRNRILLFLAVAAVAVFVLIRLSGRQPVARINVVRPIRENITASITSNGKVEPISPFILRAQLDTFVGRVLVTEGQSVTRGQLLLELNVKDAAAQLAASRARLLRARDDFRAAQGGGRPEDVARINGDLAKAVAERDRLQHNHDTLSRLLQQQAATRDELAQNDLALTKAQAEVTRLTAAQQQFRHTTSVDSQSFAMQVQQAEAEVAALEAKVRDGRITAPVSGTLYSLPVRAGDYVRTGDLLAEMADLHKVRVRAFIDEPEIGSLAVGEPVIITWDALPNHSWPGFTENVPKQVVARGSRSVGELLCSVSNDKLELLPNVNVDVRINSREHKNVLTVPRAAVLSEAGRNYAFIVRNGNFTTDSVERREIHAGIADAVSFEVTSGLSDTDLVALPGDIELRDGMKIRVMSVNNDYLHPGASQ